MKLPPLLLGSTLLFWGWQTGWWLVAIPLAIILEAQPFVRRQWELSAEQFREILKGCLLLLSLLLIGILIAQRSPAFIYTFLQGLPLIFWPLVAAQVYASQGQIRFRDLLPIQHTQQAGNQHQHTWLDGALNLTLPYFFLCVLSASAANARDYHFYLGIGGLIAWMLWAGRSKRSSPALWLCLMLLAGGMGWLGHQGLYQLQARFDQQVDNWLSPLNNQSVDPLRSKTRIGDIGLLKLSDGIVFRVAGDRQTFPMLLRDATYNQYKSSTWIALKSQFVPVHPQNGDTNWQLAKRAQNSSQLTISTTLDRGSGLLSLPNGSFQLNQLPVEKMAQNQYGVVNVEGKPGAIAYQVQFDQQQSWDSPPTAADLQVPDVEKPAIDQVLQELALDGMSPEKVLNRLSDFFQTQFNYSLKLAAGADRSTPIATFLLKHRSGHCEYFATATTLLLREAGIPARYATGFSAHEFSQLEGQYIVRGRDAHAWTIAYLNGRWQSFDTTPSTWMAQEDAAASVWQRFSDVWSFVAFKVSTSLRADTLNGVNPVWAIVLVLAILLWQLNRIKRLGRTTVKSIPLTSIAQTEKAGSDSEFYLIEQTLTEVGLHRRPDESLQDWLMRLQADLTHAQLNDLRSIIDLHYRYRFDPNGILPSDRSTLRALSQLWLDEYHQPDP
jgi:protein-glutamine gamma-glutamyltransferase